MRQHTTLRRICAATLGAVLLASCSSSTHKASSTTVPRTAPTSTTVPAPYFSPSPYAWTRSTSPDLDIGGGAAATIGAVLAPSSGQPWMAVGSRASASGLPEATSWSSPDAVTWNATPLPSSSPGQAEAAARYLGATIVVGSIGTGASQQAAVWLSSQPGASYVSVPVPAIGASSNMTMVAAGALGFFAVGTVDGRFAMWSSADGKQWSETTSAERTITSTQGARVDALLAGGDKVFAGGSVQPGTNQSAAVWMTEDGLHWSLVNTAQPEFAGPGDRAIYAMAPLGTGLVAAGAINLGAGWLPASWISPDGASWSQPSTDFPGLAQASSPRGPFGPSGGYAIRSVAAVATFTGSTSLVAAGGGPSGQDAWRSTDGIHWAAVGLPARDILSGAWRANLVAGTTDSVVVADGDPGEAHLLSGAAGAWSEPSASPSVFGPVRANAIPLRLQPGGAGLVLAVELVNPTQAIGAPNTSITYLTSADGGSWSPSSAASAGAPASLPTSNSVTLNTGTSWVAAGDTSTLFPEGWSSVNGSTWTASGTHLARQPSIVDGLCRTGLGVAAVGAATSAGASAAAAWLYSGATSWQQASVSPAPAAGGTESISGCLGEGTSLIAYGLSTGSGGVPVPALWRSSTGGAWTRSSASGFGSGSPAPLVDLAVNGNDWLAVANPDPEGGPIQSATSGQVAAAGPAATAGTDAGVGPPPSLGNGQEAAWLSADGGSTWQLIDTSVAPWPGTQSAALDLVGFAGSAPAVVGVVDGQLAVWTGTAMRPAPAGSTQPTG